MVEVCAVPMRSQDSRHKPYPSLTGEYIDDTLMSSNEENW